MDTIIRKHDNRRMSQIVAHGGTVYLAGQVATEKRGQDVTVQTEEILAKIDRLLAEGGSDNKHILSATVWLTDMGTFDEFNRVWDAWVPQGYAPARACVEAKLAAADFNVEVAVIAAVKS